MTTLHVGAELGLLGAYGRALDAQALIRQQNLRRVFQAVLDDQGAATRAEIARRTGLNAATVSSLVAELIDRRFVLDGEPAASTGGKRATTLMVDERRHLLAIVLVSPRRTRLGLVTLTGDVAHEASTVHERDEALDAVRRLAAQAGEQFAGRIVAACVQLPGTTDGTVTLESVQLGWSRVPVAAELEVILGVGAFVVNDVDAGAIAEAVVAPCPLRLYLHLGSGVGAAITAGTTVLQGATGRGGEIGHVRVLFDGRRERCRCGVTGCLESVSSMSALLGDRFDDALPFAEVQRLAAARSGDPVQLTGAIALSRALRMMAAMLDPEEIVIGGSAPALGAGFVGAVRDELELYPAQGTAHAVVRYATAAPHPYLGAAQHALNTVLGVSWGQALSRPVGEDAGTAR